MKRSRLFLLSATAAAILAVAPLSPARAQSGVPTDTESQLAPGEMVEMPMLPKEIVDPAFNQYVDVGLLCSAHIDQDPALMADVALQLYNGEQVLLRPHKAGSAADAMRLAIKIAASQGKADVLGRIAKAAEKLKLADVAKEAAAQQKVAADSRADEAAAAVSAATASADQFATYSDLLKRIQALSVVGDKDGLAALNSAVKDSSDLTEEQKKYACARVDEATETMGESTDNSIANTLRKLESDSRGPGYYPGMGGWPRPYPGMGGWPRPYPTWPRPYPSMGGFPRPYPSWPSYPRYPRYPGWPRI